MQLLGAGKTTFATKEEYWAHLTSVGDLPQGFKVGTSWISFTPQEANFPSRMNVTIIALDVRTPARMCLCIHVGGPGWTWCPADPYLNMNRHHLIPAPASAHAHIKKMKQEPTDKFALALTRNAFPGAPIRVGKKRVSEPKIQAIVVNNKVRLSVCLHTYRHPHPNTRK